MNEDFDLLKFVELFDTAMTSDNPTVRRAFKNLLMVAALVDSENEGKSIGPLEQLVQEISSLKERLARVEMTQYSQKSYGPTTMPTINVPLTNPYTPSYPTVHPASVPYQGGPLWTANGTAPTATNVSMQDYDKIYSFLNKELDE